MGGVGGVGVVGGVGGVGGVDGAMVREKKVFSHTGSRQPEPETCAPAT